MADIEVQEVEIEAIPIQIKEEVYCEGKGLLVVKVRMTGRDML
jgi:hypothetical protein